MPISTSRVRWLMLGHLGLCLGYATTTMLALPHFLALAILVAWLVLAWGFRWGAPMYPRAPLRIWPWSLIPLALWWLSVYITDSYGRVDIGAILFHFQAGIAEHGGTGRILIAILYALAGVMMLVAFTWLVRIDHRWRLLERILMLFLLALNPLLFGFSLQGAAIVAEDGAWLDRRYVPPTIEKAPEELPNLILLYLESIEGTYADTNRFGNAYRDLAALGKRGLVFRGIRQSENTGWTMAGMIASQCGTPLMPAGLIHDNQFEPLEHVLPGVNCLGDLLSAQGYHQLFMGGASLEFAGKGLFYEDHGFDRTLGRHELERRLEDPSYVNSWGLNDDSLLDMAVEEVEALARRPGPFTFVGLTLSGHPPYGYPARACLERQGEFDGVDILYSVECSAWLTRRFIERIENRGLLENTLVVVASDHLSMKNSAWQQLIAGPRENTLIMFGNGLPRQIVYREATTMDILPTLLEAMGFTLPSHRAGLGASLLSPAQTLVERHGLEAIDERMLEERALQVRLWKETQDKPPPTSG
ncbi:phosphoglycerol transferase [Modicisalibacter ilicicola DSM 19980]|uniref:Phosphoglycerol transferase n=1 Tax=Modicisalibacter ilicicola DSM 19980 TaxID=1121942 RepID=A0A1M4VRT3_9GAMM|nr:sulfatase-like hydrolase/transferase [Halomonas ilicicola]SHE71746.1 phosphoglycerol transferase [Halomonas ilicicola DSM 19980]